MPIHTLQNLVNLVLYDLVAANWSVCHAFLNMCHGLGCFLQRNGQVLVYTYYYGTGFIDKNNSSNKENHPDRNCINLM